MNHVLKCDPDIFQNIWDQKQTFEFRLKDRDYKEGDFIISRETRFTGEEMKKGMPLDYSGRYICSEIVGVLNSNHFSKDRFDDWVIISIRIKEMGTGGDDEFQPG